MMGNNGNSLENFSIGSNGVSPLIIVDWSKKRKLEDEQLTLPLSKLKCITQSSDRHRDGALSFEQEGIESAVGDYIQNFVSGTEDYDPNSMIEDALSPTDSGGCAKLVIKFEESSSSSDSNNFFGNYGFSVPIDAQDEFKPSAFSENRCNSTFRNNLYSLASRIVERKSKDRERAETTGCLKKESKSTPKRLNGTGVLDGEMDIENLKEHSNYESEFSCLDDQLLDLGISYTDLIDLEDCQDTQDDTSLYFTDGSSPINVLSAGRWNDQGTQKRERKPTIDEEFEQYFSSLML